MTDAARQWQTTIRIGRKNPDFDPNVRYIGTEREREWIMVDSKTFYGDTFSSLRQSVNEWLTENKPVYFETKIATCYYSDGTLPVGTHTLEKLPEGWHFRGSTT